MVNVPLLSNYTIGEVKCLDQICKLEIGLVVQEYTQDS